MTVYVFEVATALSAPGRNLKRVAIRANDEREAWAAMSKYDAAELVQTGLTLANACGLGFTRFGNALKHSPSCSGLPADQCRKTLSGTHPGRDAAGDEPMPNIMEIEGLE